MEENLTDQAYELGRKAFLSKIHYNSNPYNESDFERFDAWDAGWAHENQLISGVERRFEENLTNQAYKLGREAFLSKIHYNSNPFNELDFERFDAWDAGWARENQLNPEMFVHSTESFV